MRQLTHMQAAALEAWRSEDKPTHEQIAARFGVSRSAITHRLRRATLRRYGRCLGPRVRIRPIQLSLCGNV